MDIQRDKSVSTGSQEGHANSGGHLPTSPFEGSRRASFTLSQVGKTDEITPEAFLEQRLQSQIVTPIDQRKERDNCIFAITNLLKGHPENAKYFIQCDGATMILREILRMPNLHTGLAREILEMQMSCVKQVTDPKPIFRSFLEYS